MIQLFWFLPASVGIVLLLRILQRGWFFFFFSPPFFMALPDLFMFAPDKWESSQVKVSLFASVGWQGFQHST